LRVLSWPAAADPTRTLDELSFLSVEPMKKGSPYPASTTFRSAQREQYVKMVQETLGETQWRSFESSAIR
jgi:hypothetical protein